MKIDLQLIREYGLSVNTNAKYHVLFCCCTWTIIKIYTGEIRDCEQKGFFPNQNIWNMLSLLQQGIQENLDDWKECEDDTIEERRMLAKQCLLLMK